MKKLSMVFALFAVAFLVGCSTLTPVSDTGGREYFPNTEGYSWNYRRSLSTTTETLTMRLTFSGMTSVGSIAVQKCKAETIYGSSISTSESLVKVTDAAVLSYGLATNPTTEALTNISFPLSVGKKWTTSGTNEAEVVARESVTVPAGTYNNCFKLYYRSGSVSEYDWLAPNVGLVKISSFYMYGGAVTFATTIELTSKNF